LKKNTKAGQIFKELSMSIAGSKHLALKGFYNGIKSKSRAKAAIKDVARKLAKLYYDYITRVEQGLNEYEKKYKAAMIKGLQKKAKNIAYQLIPISVH
jgi:transposase